MSAANRICLRAVPDLPLVKAGDDLAGIIAAALVRANLVLADGDVLVIAQKVVSKAQGRYVDLTAVVPSARAVELAAAVDKDPRLVEVILSESASVLRHAQGVLVVEHRLGYVMANAGVDRSNVDPDAGADPVLLLPEDPDRSAEALRADLVRLCGKQVGVIINDSFGRAWRRGTVGVALGSAGVDSLRDMRGHPDLYGRELRVTEIGFADEVAAAASLVMGQADEGQPVVVVSGLGVPSAPAPARTMIRSSKEDLFRR